MSSINTNLSAMTALQALKSTQNAMNKNQNQISTGLRVGEASHNASYWSISTQMKSDNGALGAVKDSIKQSKAMINTFTSALDKTLTYLNKMKEGLVAATQPGADLQKIQTEFDAHIAGMKSTAESAQFNGQNWLKGDKSAPAAVLTTNLVVSYNGTDNSVGTLGINTADTILFDSRATGTKTGLLDNVATSIATIAPTRAGVASTPAAASPTTLVWAPANLEIAEGNKITFSVAGVEKSYTMVAGETGTSLATAIGGLSAAEGAAWDDTTGLTITSAANNVVMSGTFQSGEIAQALKNIDTAIANVTKGSAILGANKALLETQEEFISTLSDSLTAGVSAFIDADMNEASTRNQALQTQQQLGVQALSMANQNSQMILKLFQ